MKQVKLARLYRGGEFVGFSVAVDGELLANVTSTTIDSEALNTPEMRVTFCLNSDMTDKTVRVDLNVRENEVRCLSSQP